LPSCNSLTAPGHFGADFAALPESDLRTLAEANWEAGRRGAALEVLDYIGRNRSPVLVAAGQRDKYRTALQTDTTALGHLMAIGTSWSRMPPPVR